MLWPYVRKVFAQFACHNSLTWVSKNVLWTYVRKVSHSLHPITRSLEYLHMCCDLMYVRLSHSLHSITRSLAYTDMCCDLMYVRFSHSLHAITRSLEYPIKHFIGFYLISMRFDGIWAYDRNSRSYHVIGLHRIQCDLIGFEYDVIGFKGMW